MVIQRWIRGRIARKQLLGVIRKSTIKFNQLVFFNISCSLHTSFLFAFGQANRLLMETKGKEELYVPSMSLQLSYSHISAAGLPGEKSLNADIVLLSFK